jgi:hypothetical protein
MLEAQDIEARGKVFNLEAMVSEWNFMNRYSDFVGCLLHRCCVAEATNLTKTEFIIVI